MSEMLAHMSPTETVVPVDAAAPELNVVNNYDIGWREKIANAASAVIAFAGNHKGVATAAATGVAALGASAPAMGASATPAQTTEKVGSVTYTQTANAAVLVGSSKSSAEAFTKFAVIGNHRTVSKAKIRRAKKLGRCVTVSGKRAAQMGVQTQGYNGTGVKYAAENRRTTMCDTNRDGKYDTRAECGNKLRVRTPKPKQAQNTLWVNNYNKANLSVKSNMVVEARTDCRIDNSFGSVSAGAYARAESSASISLRLRNALKAGGKGISSAEIRNYNKLQLELRQKASAEVEAKCRSQGGTVPPPPPPPEVCPPGTYGTPPNCVTPPPPPPPTVNRPPTGRMNPPQHLYASNTSRQLICVDDISDPDGDAVRVTGFDFRNGANQQVGYWQNNIVTQPDGDQCVEYTPGLTPQQVTAYATLTDGKGAYTTVNGNFPVIADDFGGSR